MSSLSDYYLELEPLRFNCDIKLIYHFHGVVVTPSKTIKTTRMLNEATFLIGIILLTCCNLPMALVYLGRLEHRRRIQDRLRLRQARQ